MASPRTSIPFLQPADTAETVAGKRTGPIVPRRPRRPGFASPGGRDPSPDGELLLGRYRLSEPLGSGGFGVVWLAYDEQLRREVAVKRIPLGAGRDAERASREAQAAARLSHPAIVALYEAFAHEDSFYLISELVRGSTLARLIATDSLEDEQTLEIGIALAEALAHAHDRGVIHRDIKPQNVLVPELGEETNARVGRRAAAKLTDFGGATLTGEEALTRTGDVLGTLAYMAPEQSEGGEAGEETDLYALGLVLYESLSSINPVRRGTAAATVRQIGMPIEPLRRHRPDCPRALAEAIDTTLLPEPADRGELGDLMLALGTVGDARPSRGATRRHLRPRRRAEPVAGMLSGTPESPAPSAAGADAGAAARSSSARAPILGLPRIALLALMLLVAGWEAVSGRPGVSLIAIAALLPLQLLPSAAGSRSPGLGWLSCAVSPALGLGGLAGAFPALAGQAASWRERAALGALGYWWLTLAEPLLHTRLWLGPAAGSPARAAWEGSPATTADHVIGPLLTPGVLLGGALWAAAALLLPLLVRGRSAARDLLAVVVWSSAGVAFAPGLDSGLSAAAHPSPRGAVLGAVLGAMIALASRALRGPV